MPQMDKELFVEYIYWIFIVLLHFYSSFLVNKNFIKINSRTFLVNYFYSKTRNFKEQENIVKLAFENYKK